METKPPKNEIKDESDNESEEKSEKNSDINTNNNIQINSHYKSEQDINSDDEDDDKEIETYSNKCELLKMITVPTFGKYSVDYSFLEQILILKSPSPFENMPDIMKNKLDNLKQRYPKVEPEYFHITLGNTLIKPSNVDDLKNSFGVVGKAIDWIADVFAGWMYNVYHAIDTWKGWSHFIQNDLKGIFGFTNMIGDAVAGVLFGIYKIFSPLTDILEKVLPKIPILGKIFGSDLKFENVTADLSAGMNENSTLGSSVARTVSESRTTTTSRFSVDFKNMPKGVQVTAPEKGDFDYSRGYVLGGV